MVWRLVERTPAAGDQGHLPVVMWAHPGVPDRTAALLGKMQLTPAR
ncbi:hypothetical protein [Streptomyces lydicus]